MVIQFVTVTISVDVLVTVIASSRFWRVSIISGDVVFAPQGPTLVITSKYTSVAVKVHV